MPSLLETTFSSLRARGLRFATVSVASTAFSQVLLFGLSRALTETGLSRAMAWVVANVVAVTLAAVPSFYLNRMWVWGRDHRHVSVTREVLPFWGFAFAGLVLSTISVAVAAQFSDAVWVANAANLAAFGALWVTKFVVFDRHVFGVS
jgi:putative flippase GtrA